MPEVTQHRKQRFYTQNVHERGPAMTPLWVGGKWRPELELGELPWAVGWPRNGASLSPTCHLSLHLAASGQQG